MSSEHGPVTPLEQRCVRPGVWLIEGYRVRRIKYVRGGSRPLGTWWRVTQPDGKLADPRRTLNEVREWIRCQIEQGR